MIQVLLPQFGMGMTDGTVLTWHKSAGDRVKQGELLCDIEAAKAVVSVEAPADGVLAEVLVTTGANVPVNTPLATLLADSPGDEESAQLTVEARPAPAGSAAAEQTFRDAGSRASNVEAVSRTVNVEAVSRAVNVEAERVEAEPRARRLAKLHGVDLITVKGSGPGGRIREADVRDYVSSLTPRT